MRLKNFFASLMAVAMLAMVANAGPVYLALVLNPATDADLGSTLDGTSTRSGAGTYHLYALDDTTGGLGIAGYSVTLSNITGIENRSPSTLYTNTADEELSRGFRFVRSANDTTVPIAATSNPVFAQQMVNPGEEIFGMGKESSDFSSELSDEVSFSSTTSPSWGDYATDPLANPSQRWLFLAEGTWNAAGAQPAITAARIQVYNGNAAIIDIEECIGCPVPIDPTGVAPIVGDLDEGDVFRNAVTGLGPLPVLNSPDPPLITWSLTSFTGSGEPSDAPAFVNPLTGEFSWNTNGSTSIGPYSAVIRATNATGFDEGTLSFNLIVPEPATISLFGIAMIGTLGLVRRRNG